eukprot:comp23147_c2_seq1/m.37417 comp23147_c2_seq1/g.37417  ORF comp23147_c2_seq1/g.37417 comp23147_c2_seq1/m.37417 type:complete len:254 (-) comp23147_c2_seq1:102-863(-)
MAQSLFRQFARCSSVVEGVRADTALRLCAARLHSSSVQFNQPPPTSSAQPAGFKPNPRRSFGLRQSLLPSDVAAAATETAQLVQPTIVPTDKASRKFEIKPLKDLVYDPTVDRFTRMLMWDGKKATSERIVRGVLARIKQANATAGKAVDPVDVFKAAIDHAKPLMETRPIKVSAQIFQVPSPIKESRREWLAMKWVITAARDKNKPYPIEDRLYNEVMDCYNQNPEGVAMKKRAEVHRQALANRSYAHYRWA